MHALAHALALAPYAPKARVRKVLQKTKSFLKRCKLTKIVDFCNGARSARQGKGASQKAKRLFQVKKQSFLFFKKKRSFF